MKKEIIIAKVIKKLSKIEVQSRDIDLFIEDLKRIYQKNKNKNKDFEDQSLPREILKSVGNFMDEYIFNQKDKLYFLKESKRNKFFDFSINKHLEKSWRLILKKWDLSHYRLEGGL